MIPNFPIPDSGIPNSEFRMAYGNPGIPHHVLGGRGGGILGRGRADPGPGVTGSDTGCPMPIAGADIGCPGEAKRDQGNLIHIESGLL